MKDKITPERDSSGNAWEERALLIFLLVLLVIVLLTPSEWFLKWSMWWNNIH